MIAYEVLCQTIEDWRAGRRPSIDLSAAPADGYAQPEAAYAGEAGYDEQDYETLPYVEGEADYEQAQYAEGEAAGQYAEPGYEQPPQYSEQAYAEPGYEPMPADQSYEQLPVETSYEPAQYAEQGYDAAQYAEPEYESEPAQYAEGYDGQAYTEEAEYEQAQYDPGAPEQPVASGGTSPMYTGEPEPEQ